MARLNINGRIRDVQVEADTPLLWVIREQVGLTGTKYGCGVAQCGACSVHINGGLARSCAIPVGSVKATDKIVTIEGLSAARSHPVQSGRMTELNFDRYRLLRLAEMPEVETVIVPSYDFWGGVGEPTISVVTPAVLNAVFAATGKPVRRLPLKNVRLA